MRSVKTINAAWVTAVLVTLSATGCASVSTDATLQQLIDTYGLGSLTVGDVLNAIQDYTGQSASLPFGQTLTADQEAQISALKDQYTAGEITRQQYVEQLAAIIGPADSGRPFGGGPGGPPGPGGGGPMGPGGPGLGPLESQLNLTADQQTQAEAIFDSMCTDILALQADTKTQIDAVLTDEQRAQLDAHDHGPTDGFRHFGPGQDITRLTEELGLTADQQTQIQSLMHALRTAVDARRQQAKDEFRAILTSDQQALLDRSDRGRAPGPVTKPAFPRG